jgi:hypothetical protein
VSNEEIAKGSVGISETSHALLVSLVYDAEKPMEDRPFESIVEAFRFAFALGFDHNMKKKREGKHVTVAPRQFVVTEYLELLRAEIQASGKSLGGTISEYAEAGCSLISKKVETNQPVLSFINKE